MGPAAAIRADRARRLPRPAAPGKSGRDMRGNFSRWSRLLPVVGRKRRQPPDGFERLARHAAQVLTARLDAIEQRLERIEHLGLDRLAAPTGTAAVEAA